MERQKKRYKKHKLTWKTLHGMGIPSPNFSIKKKKW